MKYPHLYPPLTFTILWLLNGCSSLQESLDLHDEQKSTPEIKGTEQTSDSFLPSLFSSAEAKTEKHPEPTPPKKEGKLIARLHNQMLEIQEKLNENEQRITVMEDLISLRLPAPQKWQQANEMRKSTALYQNEKASLSQPYATQRVQLTARDLQNWIQTMQKLDTQHQFSKILYQVEQKKSQLSSLPSEIYFWQGKAYLGLRAYQKSLDSFHAFRTEQANSHVLYRKVLFLEAECLHHLNRHQQALRKLKQIVELNHQDQLAQRATELVVRINSIINSRTTIQ
ncbi:MAG: tetratricopeptide repeat protein [Zetaproteobacteria bacterium]|nr:tetratricopeptide repeat protein [Zetaproteobacteria bacterium]